MPGPHRRTQFLGNFVDSDMPGPHRRLRSQRRRLFRGGDDADDDGDDDEHFGFGFWEEPHGFVGVPLMDWFDVFQFQFFYQPFALSAVTPTVVYRYAGAARDLGPPRAVGAARHDDGEQERGDTAKSCGADGRRVCPRSRQ